MRKYLLSTILVLAALYASAQPGRRDMSKRVSIEKDSVLLKITSLSDDQKLIIESLYSDYEAAIKKLTEGEISDRQAFRENLRKATDEKNQMMKEVLDEDQWTIFDAMLKQAEERRKQRRGERGEGRRGRSKAGNPNGND